MFCIYLTPIPIDRSALAGHDTIATYKIVDLNDKMYCPDDLFRFVRFY